MLSVSNGMVSLKRNSGRVPIMDEGLHSFKKEDVMKFSDLMEMSNVHGTVKEFLDKVVACKNSYDNVDRFDVCYLSSSLALNGGVIYVNDGFNVDRGEGDYSEKLKRGLKMYVSYLKVRKVHNRRKDILGVYKSLRDIREKLTVDNILQALRKSDVFCIYSDYYKVEIRKGKTAGIVEVDGHKIDLSK